MQASVKFRENQNPLLRAKVPVTVLGAPFLSGVSAGDSKELSLSLSTFFESGPSLKISYRPNDSWNPFSFVVKTGIGAFGSPISAPMTISTEFSLLGRGNPTFFLRFKPQFGDFSVKKSTGSAIVLPADPSVFRRHPKEFDENHKEANGEASASSPVGESPIPNGGFSDHKTNGFLPPPPQPASWHTCSSIQGLLSGLEVNARSILPLRNRLQLKFRWGARFPDELRDYFSGNGSQKYASAGISFQKIPLLVINKVSIEHVGEEAASKNRKSGAIDDIADTCCSIQKQLEFLHAENGKLRKAVEELQSEVSRPSRAGRIQESENLELGKDRNGRKAVGGKKERWNEYKSPELEGFAGKAGEGDVNEELKKALMSATATGAGK